MSPALVLGLGNRLLMDDGIGIAVVEALAPQMRPVASIEWAIAETDLALALDLAERFDPLILVDAAVAGHPPATVSLFEPNEWTTRAQGISLHQAHLLDLLPGLAPAKRVVLVGVEPAAIAINWGLSAELERQFPAILDQVWAAILEIVAPEASIAPSPRKLHPQMIGEGVGSAMLTGVRHAGNRQDVFQQPDGSYANGDGHTYRYQLGQSVRFKGRDPNQVGIYGEDEIVDQVGQVDGFLQAGQDAYLVSFPHNSKSHLLWESELDGE